METIPKLPDGAKCCACGACQQACPVSAIRYVEGDRCMGNFPNISASLCIRCGKCVSVCPVLDRKLGARTPVKAFAARHLSDAIRMKSSSGGVFTALAEWVLLQGGCVFGASIDGAEVGHIAAENSAQVSLLRGSKYVRSMMGNSFSLIRQMLCAGRMVLFSGTPCQVASLRHYLDCDCSRLFLVDIVCHGVPTDIVWSRYVDHVMRLHPGAELRQVSFRDKCSGWRNSSVSITMDNGNVVSEPHRQNSFMKLYLRNLSLRESCLHCRFRRGKSGSDLTLCDLWGVETMAKYMDDDRGVTGVLINTERGRAWFNEIQVVSVEVPVEDVIHYNPAWWKRPTCPDGIKAFRRSISTEPYDIAANKALRTNLIAKIDHLVHRGVRKFIRILVSWFRKGFSFSNGNPLWRMK